MTQNKSRKICLIGECLSTGGAEKAMALLSRFFASKGIDVHIVIVVDSVVYAYSGELLNLGKMKSTSNSLFNKASRFLALRKFLRKNKFDYIIDFRVRVSFLQEYFISRFLYNAPTVYTVHSTMTDLYFPKSKSQARAIYKKAFAMVAVSHAVEKIIDSQYGLKNSTAIHNPIDIAGIQKLSGAFAPEETRYILAAGRMKDDVKQFDKLIGAYSKTSLIEKGIKLVILGDGQNRKALESLVSEMKLEGHVVFKGHIENPYPYMKHALFFVLSSRREGLPTVILESLASGTPVVAFDCVSGPSEMISDKENGMLVANQNFDKLTEAMELMVSDKMLYTYCKANATASVTSFSLENIGRQWLALLKID